MKQPVIICLFYGKENDKHGPLYGMTIAADGKPDQKPIKQADKPKKEK